MNFKLHENSKITKFQETFQYCCKCVCVESTEWDALETPCSRGVGIGRLKWRWNTLKWESTTVCAKIVNSDWDLIVYSTSYTEGILEWEGLESDSLGGILLLEKEINQKGMMPLSHSSEEKIRREWFCKIKGDTNLFFTITHSQNSTSLSKKPLDESESGEWKSWLKAQHSENEDHGIRSHHFMGNRWVISGNSVRLYFFGLQNHCR